MKKSILISGIFIISNACSLFSQTNFYYQEQSIHFTYGSPVSTGYVNTDTAYYPNDSATLIVDWNECSNFTYEYMVAEIELGGYYNLGTFNGTNNFSECSHVDTLKIGPDVIVDALDYSRYFNTDNLRFRFNGIGYTTSCTCSNPFVHINHLEISYPQMLPLFTIDSAVFCEGDTVRFHDINTHPAVQRSWRFPGGSPATSTDPNPVVAYEHAGYYDVIMVLSNPYATDSVVMTNYIHIFEGGTVDAGIDQTICAGDSIQLQASSSGFNYVWLSDSTISDPFSLSTSVNPVQTTSYILWSGGWSTCSNFDTVVVNVNSPIIPVISFQNNMLESSPAVFYQWYLDGNAIVGANASAYSPQLDGDYTVETIDSNGCSAVSAPYNYAVTFIKSNDAKQATIQFDSYRKVIEVTSDEDPFTRVVIFSVSGKIAKEVNYSNLENHATIPFDTNANGIYFVKITNMKGRESTFKVNCVF